MNEQIDLLFGIEAIPIPTQAEKDKRNWENAFQRWSNSCALNAHGAWSFGCCGFGVMCDCCYDNSFGRPCVRALNEWLRRQHKTIDYSVRDFEKVWIGDI